MGDELVKVLERLLANREMLHDVRFESSNAIAFVIGLNPKEHVLEYVERDDRWNQPCFLLDRMRLEYCEGNPLWEALEKLGRERLARRLAYDMATAPAGEMEGRLV